MFSRASRSPSTRTRHKTDCTWTIFFCSCWSTTLRMPRIVIQRRVATNEQTRGSKYNFNTACSSKLLAKLFRQKLRIRFVKQGRSPRVLMNELRHAFRDGLLYTYYIPTLRSRLRTFGACTYKCHDNCKKKRKHPLHALWFRKFLGVFFGSSIHNFYTAGSLHLN